MRMKRASEHSVTIVVGASAASWVLPTTTLLRERGMPVLHVTHIVSAYAALSPRVRAVLVDHRSAGRSWTVAQQRIRSTAPEACIVLVSRDRRSPDELAENVLA